MTRKTGEILVLTEPSSRSPKTTGVTFKSYDKNACVLKFPIRNQDGSPTSLIGATVRLFMYVYKEEDKKEFPVFDNELIIEEQEEGVVLYRVPEMLLAHSGKVEANIYIDFPDGSRTDNLAFTFNIEKSLIDADIQENGNYYFKDFQQLLTNVKEEAQAATGEITEVVVVKAGEKVEAFVEEGHHKIDTGIEAMVDRVAREFEGRGVSPNLFKKESDIDDSASIQAAIDFCKEKGGIVVLESKVYHCFNLNVPEGISIYGNGAILKKPNLSAEPYNMTESQMKWARLMNVIGYNGVLDSAVVSIKDLTFDGNCWEMWKIEDGYSQEQASLLFIDSDNRSEGKIRVNVESCSFLNNVSDGIHVTRNADVLVKGCRSFDCFRGGLVLTGGNAKVNCDSFVSNSDRLLDGIDVEIDSPGVNGSLKYDMNLTNILLDKKLDIDVSEGSVCNITNLIMNENSTESTWTLGVQKQGVLRMSNSTLVNHSPTSPTSCRLLLAGIAQFTSVVFNNFCDSEESISCCYIFFYQPDEQMALTQQRASFHKCSFSNKSSLQVFDESSPKVVSGVSTGASVRHSLDFLSCIFENSLHTACTTRCKRTYYKDCIFDAQIYGIRFNPTSFSPQPLIKIDNPTIMNEEVVYIKATNATRDFAAIVEHSNTIIDNSVNKVDFGNSMSSQIEVPNDHVQTVIQGSRTIYVSHDPNEEPYVSGLIGDVAILAEFDNFKKWQCVRNQSINTPFRSIWEEIK